MADSPISPEISADFPFSPNFVEVHGSRMHYVDQGEGDPILFLHGNPTSSYLWRNIIPHLTGLGRCLAPDLIGMGKSDKPDIDYSFFDHVKYIEGFIDALGLKNITLVVHDWGSALGLHYARRHEGNIKGFAFMEAILGPVRRWDDMHVNFQAMFKKFRTPDVGWEMIVDQNFFVEKVLPGSIVRKMTDEEMNHYREPFLDPPTRKPVWRWPNEIPIEGEPADVVEAAASYKVWMTETGLPKILFYAQPGALIREPAVEWCRGRMKNLTLVDIGPGVHFVQEDNPHGIGVGLADWYGKL